MDARIFQGLVLFFSFLFGLCMTGVIASQDQCPHESHSTEWLPSLGWPVTDRSTLESMSKAATVDEAVVVYRRNIDLDGDGKEDSIVTFVLPANKGPYWTERESLTCVFRGTEDGAFSGSYKRSMLWFSLVTLQRLDHVRQGDKETRRLFSLSHGPRGWQIRINEYRYGNRGGDRSTRAMRFLGEKSRVVDVSKMGQAIQSTR